MLFGRNKITKIDHQQKTFILIYVCHDLIHENELQHKSSNRLDHPTSMSMPQQSICFIRIGEVTEEK